VNTALEKHVEARRDLAAILRWAHRLGLSEGICNHFSFAVNEAHFLVNPFGCLWSELRASHLLLVDHDGVIVDGDGQVEPTALFIHSRIHRGVPQARCVLHTHMPYATALTSLEHGRLEMIGQNSLRFLDNVAYDNEYNGLALDTSEGDRISHKLGGKRILFLANHGVVVINQSIATAFDDLYYLERACQIQLIAQSTGLRLKFVDPEIARKTRDQFVQDQSFANAHLSAIRRVLDRECPDYAS